MSQQFSTDVKFRLAALIADAAESSKKTAEVAKIIVNPGNEVLVLELMENQLRLMLALGAMAQTIKNLPEEKESIPVVANNRLLS